MIEQSDKLGGRLKSDVIDFNPSSADEHHSCVKEEEGGMRFSADEHVMPRLWKLIKDLDFKEEKDGGDIIPFLMTPNGGINSNRNSFS